MTTNQPPPTTDSPCPDKPNDKTYEGGKFTVIPRPPSEHLADMKKLLVRVWFGFVFDFVCSGSFLGNYFLLLTWAFALHFQHTVDEFNGQRNSLL